MSALTLARPARPLITNDLMTAQWERLALWYLNGPIDDAPVWAAVDALASTLPQEERTRWFEQLYSALPIRDGDVDWSAVPLDERNPDVIERTACEAVDEAIAHLAGWSR